MIAFSKSCGKLFQSSNCVNCKSAPIGNDHSKLWIIDYMAKAKLYQLSRHLFFAEKPVGCGMMEQLSQP
ncbi:hypothetical protein QYF36_002921 [Acer negundo]|nr:hypothetical protein QYF36_002921 [Acer negundo]